MSRIMHVRKSKKEQPRRILEKYLFGKFTVSHTIQRTLKQQAQYKNCETANNGLHNTLTVVSLVSLGDGDLVAN